MLRSADAPAPAAAAAAPAASIPMQPILPSTRASGGKGSRKGAAADNAAAATLALSADDAAAAAGAHHDEPAAGTADHASPPSLGLSARAPRPEAEPLMAADSTKDEPAPSSASAASSFVRRRYTVGRDERSKYALLQALQDEEDIEKAAAAGRSLKATITAAVVEKAKSPALRDAVRTWLPRVLSRAAIIAVVFAIAAILLSVYRTVAMPSVQLPPLRPRAALKNGEPSEFVFADLAGMTDLRDTYARNKITQEMATELGTFALHLSEAIQFKTVSYVNKTKVDWSQFLGLHEYMARTYPLTFKTLKVETIADYSLLMTWEGSDKSVLPVLFAAHTDVVPVDPDSLGGWKEDPWSGNIKDGFIWGRGAMDDKVAVIALLDSVERLIRLGFQPQRTIMLAFGHDEEVSGVDGAKNIGRVLKERGMRFEFIMDEGLTVINQVFPNLQRPLALVGMSEKGFLVLQMSVNVTGGHSSFPPPHTAIGFLSEAIAKLEAKPFPSKFEGPAVGMLSSIAPEMENPYSPLRFAIANLWVFRDQLVNYLSSLREIGPFFKTTQAVTVFHAGTKFNVLPAYASAEINFRLAPWDSIADVLKRVREVVNENRPESYPEIQVKIADVGHVEASPVSDPEGPAYQLLAGTIRHVFQKQNVVVAPGIMIANTDTRYYWSLTDSILRFNPLWMAKQDLARIHGVNERVSLLELAKAVEFFTTLIRNVDEWKGAQK